MSRLTRDGTAEPVSRDKILRRKRGQEKVYFPCSADHEQDWQPHQVDPYSVICATIHTYTHTTKSRHFQPIKTRILRALLYSTDPGGSISREHGQAATKLLPLYFEFLPPSLRPVRGWHSSSSPLGSISVLVAAFRLSHPSGAAR